MLNDAKVAYKEEISGMGVTELPEKPPYEMVFTLFPKTKRSLDISNILTIVQKFADDALVELGLIEDDNHEIIQSITYKFGAFDKENPRAELVINEYRP